LFCCFNPVNDGIDSYYHPPGTRLHEETDY
jgi:hypothetical protein